MPIYEYLDQVSGRIVERFVPVAERDNWPGRLTAPRRVAVCPRGRPSQEAEAMAGLYKVEQQMGTGVFGKGFPFTVEQTRKAWGAQRSTSNFAKCKDD